MEKLISGLGRFQSEAFQERRELFAALERGQAPEALFITCADSRINPNLITQTEPGDLFILRAAGNVIPPYGAPSVGEAATIEYAIEGLGIRHIIVCGHSLCGAMQALLHPEATERMPALRAMLTHAEAARRIVEAEYESLDEVSKLRRTVEQNVMVQVQNLRTHPSVHGAVAAGRLELHAWVYDISRGEVHGYNKATNNFSVLSHSHFGTIAPPERLARRA